jgi:hypothetical protein
MVTLLLTLTVLSMAVHGPAAAIDGRVVDGRSGNAIGGAEITIVGQRGSVRSDRAGRFRWSTRPPLPAEVIIVLPGGLVARPIRLTELDLAGELTLTVDRDVRSDVVTVFGASPTIDASPGSASTLLTAADLELRHPGTLSQALDVVAGVSTISEGQGAVPAIRGMARGRTLILVDWGRADRRDCARPRLGRVRVGRFRRRHCGANPPAGLPLRRQPALQRHAWSRSARKARRARDLQRTRIRRHSARRPAAGVRRL